MKIYAIKDEETVKNKTLAYLFYHENSCRFFIEIPSDADEWEVPLILSSFVHRKIYFVDSYWAGKWVMNRIVPPDRQNLGMILKKEGLKEYDIHKLLALTSGRCSHDSCYIERIDHTELPKEIQLKLTHKLRDIMPLDHRMALALFKDGTIKMIDFIRITGYLDSEQKERLERIINRPDLFSGMNIVPGGNGVEWSEQNNVHAELLYEHGTAMPFSFSDLSNYIENRLVDTSEACLILGCSRQYINQLVKDVKLTPVRSEGNNRLFLRSDVNEVGE